MKKFFVTGIISVAMAAMLAGCGVSNGAANATTEAAGPVKAEYSLGLAEDGSLANADYKDYVTLCDYKALEIAKEDVAASDEEIQSQIDSIMANYDTTKEVDRAAKSGDTVNIDYVGTVDGTEFEGGSAEGYDLVLGSGSFIDTFEDQLIGHKAGDEVKVEVTFPENYGSEELAGKAAVFQTKINTVSEPSSPKLTDKWVKETLEASYGYTSVKDMKQQIRDKLEATNLENAVMDKLLNSCEFKEIPEELAKERFEVYLGTLTEQLTSYGMSIDDYLSMYGYSSIDDLYDLYHDTAVQSVKLYLAVDAIVDQEGIEITDEILDEYFQGQDYSQFIDYYSANYVNRFAKNYTVEKLCESNAIIK